MTAEHRLVLDTNLWVSRLLAPAGTAARAVDAALSWGTPLMSHDTLQELAEVLARPKFDPYVSIQDRQEFLRRVGAFVRIVPILHRVNACRDPKDDKFLQVALNGGASWIVTGDADLLVLHPFHEVAIVSPADFLQRLASD